MESLEKFSQKIDLLEEKNKILEKEINNLKLENEKLKSEKNDGKKMMKIKYFLMLCQKYFMCQNINYLKISLNI